MPGLSWLVHELSEHGFPLPDDEPEDVIERVAALLDIDDADAEQRLRGDTAVGKAPRRSARRTGR